MIVELISLLFSPVGILLSIIVALAYYHAKTRPEFFRKQGIKFIEPSPLLGNMIGPMTNRITYAEHYKKIYDAFPDEPVVGMFEFLKQVHLIKDPELIKQIQIKEFDSFTNHRVVVDHETDPVFGRNLFVIKDQRWREMRTILSPAFTGAKMRFLFELIRQCAQNGVDYISKEAKSKGGLYEFEAKDFFTRCSNDVIATSAFGIEVNSIKDKENEFYNNARKLNDFGVILSLKFFTALNMPSVLKWFGLRILDVPTSNYFRDTVLEAMKYREKHNVVRPDMIQLLLQAKTKGVIDDDQESTNGHSNGNRVNGTNNNNTPKPQGSIKWTDDDFVAQSVLFFLAGFDTTSTLFSFMAYELARHPEIQEKLFEEVNDLKQELNGKNPSYEDITKMKYMEQVMNETLRLWPPSIASDRACNKSVTLEDSNGNKFKFNAGDGAFISTFALHRDPKLFPNPERFDPERFSDENKASINPFAFQPFGLGPRQCIGNRFAIMECKVLFFYIMSRFKIEPSAKTEIPLKLKLGVFQNIPANGMWLQYKCRE